MLYEVITRQIQKALPNHGLEVEVVCCDEPDASWIHESGMKIHAIGRGKGTYGYSKSLKLWLEQNVRKYDKVIIHGLWQYP